MSEDSKEILGLIKAKTKESLDKAIAAGSVERWLSETTVSLIGILQYIGQGGVELDAIRAMAMQGLEYKKIMTEMTIMAVVEELGGSAEAREKVDRAITDLQGAEKQSETPAD